LTPSSKTGLFSAAVAAFVAVSVQDLKPSSQDISAFYLANIYQILNGSQIVIPPSLSDPSTFSPPTSAVWVNSLWFLSLLISLTCALLATLLQQWARRYMRVTQKRYSPHKRARIRAFFAEGVDKLHLPWAVEALPALLHLSLFLFFAGLAVYLFNINHTVFKVAISWIGFCTGMYICITLMPIFRHDSPYYAPLSSLAWYLYIGIRSTLSPILFWIANRCSLGGLAAYWEQPLQGIEKESEETALKATSEIDGRVLMWTYETLDEDHELEQFFTGLPGFCSSNVVENPRSCLNRLRGTVDWALYEFLGRTWSSNLVSETIKIRRLVICIRAIDAAHFSFVAYFMLVQSFGPRSALRQSVELGHSLISWGNNDNRTTAFFAQGIIACIIANVPRRNERWFSLTIHHLGISEHVLRGYLVHDNSVLLATLIHFTRQFVRNFLNANWEDFPLSEMLWRLRSNYSVQDTLPSLQRDFCSLWNEVVLQRRDRDHHLFSSILLEIHPIYVALHQGSTLGDGYQLCSIPSHLMDSASNLNEVGGGRTPETARAPIVTSPALYHHDAIPSVIPFVSEYDAPPSRTSNLNHAIPLSLDEQARRWLLDIITPVDLSLHLTPLEIDRISDATAPGPIQGTTDPFAISSVVDTGSRYTSCHGIASRPTRNIASATPSFVPDTVPPLIPLLTVSPVPAAPHLFADPAGNRSGDPPDDGSISQPSSQNFTPFTLAPQVISAFDSNAATEIGPLDAPDDTLDLNRGVMSQSFTRPSPDGAEYSPRPEDGDPSETSGPSQ